MVTIKEADPHFLRLAELMDQQSRDAITREHQWQETLLNVIKELKPASKEAVLPLKPIRETEQRGPLCFLT